MKKTTAFIGASILSLAIALDYLHSASTAQTLDEANAQIAEAKTLLGQLLRLADEASLELKPSAV